MRYAPPSPEDLRTLKHDLDKTGDEMAELFGIGGSHQWRKYTGGQAPRVMSAQMLFFAAARLELPPEQIERVLDRMRAIGAEVDLAEPVES